MLTDYTFFAIYETVETEVYPVINTLVFEDKLDDSTGAIRRTLDSEFVFNNKNGSTDFTYFYSIKQANPCGQISLQVRYKGITKYTGIVRIGSQKTRFNVSLCTFSVKLDINDPYTCFFKNWEKEFDILDETDKVFVKPFLGELENAFCTDSRGSNDDNYTIVDVPLVCVDLSIGWVLVEHFTRQEPVDEFGNESRFYSSRYVREKLILAPELTPPGDGWILAADNSPVDKTWVRSPQTSEFTEFQVYDRLDGQGPMSYVYFK